jgi:hypothetical protein
VSANRIGVHLDDLDVDVATFAVLAVDPAVFAVDRVIASLNVDVINLVVDVADMIVISATGVRVTPRRRQPGHDPTHLASQHHASPSAAGSSPG